MQRVPQLPLAPGYPGTLYCVLIARTQGPGQNEGPSCACVCMYRLVFSLRVKRDLSVVK